MGEAWGSEPCRLLITFSSQPMSTGFASMTNGPATCQIVGAPQPGGRAEGRRGACLKAGRNRQWLNT